MQCKTTAYIVFGCVVPSALRSMVITCFYLFVLSSKDFSCGDIET